MRAVKQPFTFQFSSLAFSLRLGVLAVCGVLAFVALAGTTRYVISLPKDSGGAGTAEQNPTQNPANTPTQQNPSTINQPQTGSGSGSGSTTACKTSQKSALTSQYNTQIAQENTRHNSAISFLTKAGAPPASFAAENATYASNIASINSQYQNNLRSIGC